MGDLAIEWLGRVPYAEALELQQQRLAARRRGEASDSLLLLEHPPVITRGRSARPEHLLARPAGLRARGIEVHEVSRGGDITYHAPGQLVGYLIIDLAARGQRDAHRFLREIEAGLCDALATVGIAAEARPGTTGVFVAQASAAARPRKIASIGVGLKGWVSWHGFALNVDLDLAGFEAIVACGLRDIEMTSIARELGAAPTPGLGERTRAAVKEAFAKRF
jgi:lipoyl(octanoyl) transferase